MAAFDSFEGRRATSGIALECRGVSMRFGDVAALQDINIAFAANGIHAVLGQNGAGKTTFSSICAGILKPTAGQVLVDGSPLQAGSVDSARTAGIELVHQSFALPPSFTVAEALEFGSTGSGRLYSRRKLNDRWSEHLDRLGMKVGVDARIGELPVEMRQSVEIARALASQPHVLILDEPTAVLSPEAADGLFEQLKRLRDQRVTVILVLHKIREVFAVAETVSVLRGGRLIQAPCPVKEINSDELVKAIIGTKSNDSAGAVAMADVVSAGAEKHAEESSKVVELTDIDAKGPTKARSLDGVNLKVKRGEIVGIAGVEGNGQDTLVELIAGLVKADRGEVLLEGHNVTNVPLARRRSLGLRIIPFDRNREGLSLSTSLWENWACRRLIQQPMMSLIRPISLQKEARESFINWGVRFSETSQRVKELSGGNAQKVILAREIDASATLVIAAQPTRGLDVGASRLVWDALRACRKANAGILLISSDLDELFDICDRVVVMLSGRIVGEFSHPYDIAMVGAAMTGAHHHLEH